LAWKQTEFFLPFFHDFSGSSLFQNKGSGSSLLQNKGLNTP